jgi:hypothetical protein
MLMSWSVITNHNEQRRWHIFDNIKYQNQVVSSHKTLYNNTNETRNNSNSRRSKHQS